MKLTKHLRDTLKKFKKLDTVQQILLVAVSIYILHYVVKKGNALFVQEYYLEGLTGQKTFTFFKMNGCPHCVKMEPEWSRFKAMNSTNVQTKELEASNDAALAKKYKVKGYPTLLMVQNGQVIETYSGDRTAEGFNKFAEKHSS
mgnify:CR=1 FL=1